MKCDNRGFTLIELMVVFAILGVLAGTATLCLSTVFSTRERKCAADIDTLLSQCRVLTLSGAQEPVLRLTLEGDDYFGIVEVGGDEYARERLGSKRLEVCFTADEAEHRVDDADLLLAFYRDTGALYSLDEVAGNLVSGSCTRISVGKYTVELTPSTGYHRLMG